MWSWIIAGGVGLVAYLERTKIIGFVDGLVSPKFAPTPPVHGYTPPAAPPGVPPSYVYQGPPVAPSSTSTGNSTTYAIAPGHQTVKSVVGDTFNAVLPAGATWVSGSGTLVPTSIGGNTTADESTGSDTLTITDINGSGTITFNWVDSTGFVQQTLLDVTTS